MKRRLKFTLRFLFATLLYVMAWLCVYAVIDVAGRIAEYL